MKGRSRTEAESKILWRMPSPGIWRRVVLIRTDVSEELIASMIRVEIVSELGTTLAVTRNWNTLGWSTNLIVSSWYELSICSLPAYLVVTANVVPGALIPSALLMEVIRSSKTSIHATATRRHIPEDCIFQSPQWKLQSYIALTGWAQ
jgi:hypothetical protein